MEVGLFKTEKNSNQLSKLKDLEIFGFDMFAELIGRGEGMWRRRGGLADHGLEWLIDIYKGRN